MNAYINTLVKTSSRESTPCSKSILLRDRFLTWFATVPEIARQRPWGMIEFERALGTQGRYISPVLLALGWRRKRKWGTAGQYCRYWVPPA